MDNLLIRIALIGLSPFAVAAITGCSQLYQPSPLDTLLNTTTAPTHTPYPLPKQAPGNHPGQNGALSTKEMGMARTAWQYFEKNYQPSTGLVNAVDGYPSTTLWDVASYMGALVAAYELQLIDKPLFNARIIKLLETFNRLSFYKNSLPHKVYHTQTLQKVTYSNKPGEIGFSGLDLGRLLVWLKIIKERYPEYAPAIGTFVARWDFSEVVDENGTIYGASRNGGGNEISKAQEGRLGYEEYAAKGYNLWGIGTLAAAKAEPYAIAKIYDIDIPYDARDPKEYYAHNSVVTESYLLDALEFNWDEATDNYSSDKQYSHPWMAEIAQHIYAVQERRYKLTGTLTARTEHQLDQKPYFVYDCIYSDGHPWMTITEQGQYVPQFAAVSIKAALGMWAVWKTGYTDLLFTTFADANEPQNGFYEGVYENGSGTIKKFTANTNGIILEALLYKVQGKLLRL